MILVSYDISNNKLRTKFAKDLSKFLATLEIKTKVFYENRDEALDLIREILLTSDFTDDKRLKEIIAECRSRMQASMTGSGHTVAALRALSYFSPTAACAQQLSGMVQDVYKRQSMI